MNWPSNQLMTFCIKSVCVWLLNENIRNEDLFSNLWLYSYFSQYICWKLHFFLMDENKILHFIKWSSFGYLMGINSCDLAIILILILTLSSQLIYYYNHRNGIKPTFLRVFQMMSGLVTPKSIGLFEEKDIKKLIKTNGKLFKITMLNNNMMKILTKQMVIRGTTLQNHFFRSQTLM